MLSRANRTPNRNALGTPTQRLAPAGALSWAAPLPRKVSRANTLYCEHIEFEIGAAHVTKALVNRAAEDHARGLDASELPNRNQFDRIA